MAHAGCAEDHTSRESAPTWEKVDRRIPSKRRGCRGDQEVFQDRPQHNGTLGFPSLTKEKARDWDENSYTSELVPLCATVRNVSNEDEQGWKTVKGRKETNAPIETQTMMKEVNSGGGTRFDALKVTLNSEEDFPVLMADVQNGAAKQTRTIMKKMPKKGSQAEAKQENRTHGEVARVGHAVPTFAKIEPSGMRETLSRGGHNCRPLLGVVADDKNDKLFTERAKEIREICMKERAGDCEHRKLYHDRPPCALPQQTGSQWQG